MSGDPVRVVLDHRIFATQAWGGVSRYFVGMARHLPALGVKPRVVSPLHHNRYLSTLPRGQVWGWRLPEFGGSRRLAMACDDALARPLAALSGAQIVHETYYGQSNLVPKGAAIVLTIYDMIHELFDKGNSSDTARADKAAAIARADRILCISHSTLSDLLRFYPEAEGRARVTHLGFDAGTFGPGGSARADFRPFLLHVGHRRGYKNFAGLLGGYASSARLRSGFDLVCGGGAPFDAAELGLIAEHGLEGKVRHVPADDATLAVLYAGAALFIYPSLYEGFGIPPLEAMAAGCPVVAVRASSVPEVCGEAAHYAEDGSPEALGAAIEAVVWSPCRHAELRAAGAERIKGFTWKQTAAQTAACYKELV